ncbi:MAG: flagellar basal-body MS-ring/collar protein FliF [Gemmataceae bacterium]|nr:flagellar basal-body MS-ring/collar protein FliF [Gemmataceae bacterium]MDW8241987.1 flagellar basal-body MS-ring/collar protein FliF [Thermogemmata sp.]
MEPLRRFWQQLRQYWSGLSLLRRLLIGTAAVGLVAALGAVAYLSQAAPYRPLFTDLPPEEVAAIRSRLSAANIPHRLIHGGTGIEVPEDRFAEARVTLAAEGLPRTGGKGYELFDETSLVATPFVQTVNYQRALQAELARAIMQLEPVRSARVLIARPEPTPFVREQRPPTASVVLTLKPGATAPRSLAASIVALVARSVEGLKPENVTVVDASGRLLSDPHLSERDEMPTPQLEYRRELENYLAAKAEQLLAQHLGPGRAVVRVSAEINFQKVKERRETYYPDERAVGAERLTTVRSSGGTARGIAGVTSNVPRSGSPPAPPGAGATTSSEEVIQTDYLVSRSIRDLEDGRGAVTRLTVAALVDLTPPVEGQNVISLQDAEEIIKQAVGFRAGRDQIKLTNVRLVSPPAEPEVDEEWLRLQRWRAYVSMARNVSLVVAIALTLLLVPLLLWRRRAPAAPAAPSPEQRRQQDIQRLIELAQTQPQRVAAILKLLLGAGAPAA